MSRHITVRQLWELEAGYCREPEAWLHQALNLRGNLEALLLYDCQVFECLSENKIQLPLPAFWSAGVERMLMGFSLENLLKALILRDPTKADQVFAKEGNLHWAVSSHDLAALFAEAGIEYDHHELVFINLWTTCSTWAGRYPLPKNENQLPHQRKPSASSEELRRRRSREIEKTITSGGSLQPEQFDLLHSGVGTQETEIYRRLFDRLREYLERAIERHL